MSKCFGVDVILLDICQIHVNVFHVNTGEYFQKS